VSAAPLSYPPEVIGSYAFLGDGERGALIGPRGDVAWLCAPHWDSDAVFSSLLGGESFYAVTPKENFTWGGYYEPGSLIWRSRWVTNDGIIECREALRFPADPERVVLLRQLTSPDCAQEVNVHLAPLGAFDTEPLSEIHHHGALWTARLGSLWIRWRASDAVRVHRAAQGGQRWDLAVSVAPGDVLNLVLEISSSPFEDDPPDPDEAWHATEAAWAEEVPSFDESLDPRGSALAYAVLRGLTGGGGGMVAAATTSLPERAEEGRNYDYRYVWIRDQAYAGEAAAAAGAPGVLDSAVRFITARLHEHGPDLAPAYRSDGTAIPDQSGLQLTGYPGASALVGNHVNQQFQLDAFGESLLVFAAAGRLDRLDLEGQRAAEIAAAAIEQRWHDLDAGIWEIDNRAWTHSRLICAAGLRQMARVVSPTSPANASQWLLLADQIVADTSGTSLHPSGHWQRRPRTPTWTRRCCSRRCAGRWRPTIRAAWPRSRPTSISSASTATPIGFATVTCRSPRRKDLLRSAASSRRWRSTSKGIETRRCAGSSERRAVPGPRPFTPKSGTCTSTSCAATCPKPSFTPCTSKPPRAWRAIPGVSWISQ
jgi:hypothetical protein